MSRISALLFLAPLFASQPVAGESPTQANANPTVFVESGAGVSGGELVTDLIAIIPAGVSVETLRVELHFDGEYLAYRATTWPATAGTAVLQPSDLLTVSTAEEFRCVSGSTCHLASVVWLGKRAGESVIAIVAAEVLTGDGPVSAQTSGAVAVVGSASQQQDPGSGLGAANAVIVAGLAIMAGGALAALLLLLQRRIVAPKQKPEHAVAALDSPGDLADFLSRYLDNVQDAARADQNLDDVDGMARAEALRPRSGITTLE